MSCGNLEFQVKWILHVKQSHRCSIIRCEREWVLCHCNSLLIWEMKTKQSAHIVQKAQQKEKKKDTEIMNEFSSNSNWHAWHAACRATKTSNCNILFFFCWWIAWFFIHSIIIKTVVEIQLFILLVPKMSRFFNIPFGSSLFASIRKIVYCECGMRNAECGLRTPTACKPFNVLCFPYQFLVHCILLRFLFIYHM